MNRENRWTKWNNESDLDDLVEVWHDLDNQTWDSWGQPDLFEFLGLTKEEYFRWTEEPGWIDKKLKEE